MDHHGLDTARWATEPVSTLGSWTPEVLDSVRK